MFLALNLLHHCNINNRVGCIRNTKRDQTKIHMLSIFYITYHGIGPVGWSLMLVTLAGPTVAQLEVFFSSDYP